MVDDEVGVGDAEMLAESRSPKAVNLFFSRAVWESLAATKKKSTQFTARHDKQCRPLN
jgi:hypothetical protein